MKITTKLILLLILLVGAVMLTGGYYILHQRQEILTSALHNEVRAHALTLRIALEGYYRAGQTREAQRLIDRLSQNEKIYGVLLFDSEGQVSMVSNPLVAEEIRFPPEVKRVIASGEPVEIVRRIRSEEVFSIITPIRISPNERGAFEIAQPRSLIDADFARARRDTTLMTLTLFAAISFGVLIVMRNNLERPINELLNGATALGEGDLYYRVIVPPGGNEFFKLASEFNRMADSLSAQKRTAEIAAEERLKLEQQLLNAERLAAVGRLAAGVAHEMGAPLNVIKGRIEQLLEHQGAPQEKIGRNLTIINHQVDAIARIVRQLLNLGRPVKLRRQLIGLSSLVIDVVELIDADASRNAVNIEVACDDRIRVEGDRDLLHQVLMNLCLNGLQAMKAGGRLRVEVQNAAQNKGAAELALVRVSDTGPGIAPENLASIFDPFYTTKDVGQGTGLGLTVSRRIIEEHGGWIEAENNSSGGATFTVYLPKVDASLPLPMEEMTTKRGAVREDSPAGR